MDMQTIRHNCRLLYHLTQIPVFCQAPDGSICFTYPRLEGMDLFRPSPHAQKTAPKR